MRTRTLLAMTVVLALVLGACTASEKQPEPAGGGPGPFSLSAPLAAADPEAFRQAEAALRREGRGRAGLAQLGPGALEFAQFMDRTASFLLAQLPARLSALLPRSALAPRSTGAGAAGGRLAAPRNGLPPPGAQVLGAYLITTQGFDSLLQKTTETMGLNEKGQPIETCPCSKTETVPLTTDEVTVEGNKGTIRSTMTMSATFNGSKVSLDITIKVEGEVRDAATGALLYKISNEATGHADGDVCPDASGTARAYMLFGGHEDYFEASGGKTGKRVSESFGGELRIRADDSARIAGVDISPTGQGGELMMRLAAQSTAPAFEKAWRSGACVAVIVSPEGGDVDRDSDTTVTVKVKHKIEGNELDKPVEPKFDGLKSIEPTTKQKAPATYHYTAGSADGDRGSVTFESVSNRGIGHRTVTFTVGGGWKVSSVGSLTETVAATGSRHSVQVSFTDVKVIAGKDNALSGSGPITLKGSFEARLGDVVCSAPIDRTFPVTLTGLMTGTGPAAVLKLRVNAPTPPGQMLRLTCDDVTIDVPQPGEGNFYGFALGELELPAAGGTKSFDRSAVVALAAVRATATVTVVRNTR